MKNTIIQDHQNDGIDRRGFLHCMAWAGTGVVWRIGAGMASSRAFGQQPAAANESGFSFVQISDSHMGFNKPANTDVTCNLAQRHVDRINAITEYAAGFHHPHGQSLTHSSKPERVADTLDQVMLRFEGEGQVFYVPGEHDNSVGDVASSTWSAMAREQRGKAGTASIHKGVHFVGLVNSAALEGMERNLGADFNWNGSRQTCRGRSSSTPLVLFAHLPLWTVYPDWGWGTQDSEQALSFVKRFGSVTVLNGHIHQVMQKVEGNVAFHTAMSTAFPQPAPGSAPAPGPLKVPAEQLRSVLGIRDASRLFRRGRVWHVVDRPLTEGAGN